LSRGIASQIALLSYAEAEIRIASLLAVCNGFSTSGFSRCGRTFLLLVRWIAEQKDLSIAVIISLLSGVQAEIQVLQNFEATMFHFSLPVPPASVAERFDLFRWIA